MVAAPGLDVVLENLPGNFAHHRIPRGAIAGSIADQQIGSILRIRSAINLVRNKHAGDPNCARSRIDQPIQLFLQLVFQRLGFGRIHNSLLLAAFDIQIKSVEAHGVSAGARPIHVLEPVAALGLAILQRQISVLVQPRIHVHAACKRLESMIGDHHQQRVVINFFHHAPDQAIHALVQILNHRGMLTVRHIARCRMIFFQVTPEHVLDAVGRIENACAQPLLCFLQRIKEHPLAIFMIAVSLRQEGIVIEHVLVERPRVFRQAERGIRPEELGQIN